MFKNNQASAAGGWGGVGVEGGFAEDDLEEMCLDHLHLRPTEETPSRVVFSAIAPDGSAEEPSVLAPDFRAGPRTQRSEAAS